VARHDAPQRTIAVVGAPASFGSISALLGSPILGAFLLMEAAGLRGAALPAAAALPGVVAGATPIAATAPMSLTPVEANIEDQVSRLQADVFHDHSLHAPQTALLDFRTPFRSRSSPYQGDSDRIQWRRALNSRAGHPDHGKCRRPDCQHPDASPVTTGLDEEPVSTA
jgi:hypothetical protein